MLADGTTFEGELIGAEPAAGIASGEVVFNTVLSGYQEVLVRPRLRRSDHHLHLPAHRQLRGQRRRRREPAAVLPGASSSATWPGGDPTGARPTTSTPTSRRHGVPGIAGIDTRRLTRHIRDAGAMPGAFGTGDEVGAEGRGRGRAGHRRRRPGRHRDLRRAVHGRGAARRGARRIVAYDFGIKRTILRHLSGLGEVNVVPASTPADEVLARRPDGVFLSNGPGDPAAVAGATEAIRASSTACRCSASASATSCSPPHSAATTYKLPFGHHGGNHPVRRLATGRVEITSQNHNFAVAEGSLGPASTVTHVNLNDGVIEGIRGRVAAGLQRAVPPRGRPRPPRRRLPVRRVRRPDRRRPGSGSPDAPPHRHRVDPADRRRAPSSSARPASSTTRAPRPAGSSGRRATG